MGVSFLTVHSQFGFPMGNFKFCWSWCLDSQEKKCFLEDPTIVLLEWYLRLPHGQFGRGLDARETTGIEEGYSFWLE